MLFGNLLTKVTESIFYTSELYSTNTVLTFNQMVQVFKS